MSFIPFVDTIEAVFEFRLGGQEVKNVLNYHSDVAINIALLEALGSALIKAFLDSAWWGTDIAGIIFDDIKLTDLTSASSPTATVVDFTGGNLPLAPTAHTDDVVANNAALVVTHRTDSRGRSFRGRTYLAGMRNALTDTTTSFVAGVATNAIALMNDLDDAAVSVNCGPVVASREAGGVPRSTGVTTLIREHACNTDIDSQRRRLAGRGA
jgi:hypothetical protein